MEKNPGYKNVDGPYMQWRGPTGVKEDGGGCTRGRGRVGPMLIHRAACNRDKDGAQQGLRLPEPLTNPVLDGLRARETEPAPTGAGLPGLSPARRARQRSTWAFLAASARAPCLSAPTSLTVAIAKAVEEGHDVNEVEAAGNTPLHFACYEGWLEGCGAAPRSSTVAAAGSCCSCVLPPLLPLPLSDTLSKTTAHSRAPCSCELLLSLGAKVNASNNAGDRCTWRGGGSSSIIARGGPRSLARAAPTQKVANALGAACRRGIAFGS